jgi:hypothetical protein
MQKPSRLINAGVWLIFAYFILNCIGNIASAVSIENLIFAPLTVIQAFLTFRLAIERIPDQNRKPEIKTDAP